MYARGLLYLAGIVGTITQCTAGAVPPDRKLIYEPLSTEARQLGRLDKYARIPRTTEQLTLGGMKLTIHVPAWAEAYDAVPLTYRLEGRCDPDQRVAIEAVAFEEEARRKGAHLYDLAIPGNLKIRIEYLGSQTGILEPGRVVRLSAESRPSVYPPYRLRPFVRSGTVERGNYLFLKFRITNIGDTILDPEGFGGWMSIIDGFWITPEGRREHYLKPINQFGRHLGYIYPGESVEEWVDVFTHGNEGPAFVHTLRPGTSIIRYQAAYRWNAEYDWGVNLWAGRPWMALEVPLECAAEARQTPVEPTEIVLDHDPDRMCRYVRSLEEFMTSFRIFEKEELAAPCEGTLHLQVAPWTRHIVVKLIGNTPGRITTVAVPVRVDPTGLVIAPCPDNPFVLGRGPGARPWFMTQEMAAMRTCIQLGPEPEKHLADRLEEMQACGVNILCSTAGDWHIPEIYNPQAWYGDALAETFKWFFDVLVPGKGMAVIGWGLFPARTGNVTGLGGLYWGEKFDIPAIGGGFTYSSRPELDIAHPDFPRAYAGVILWNSQRWGGQWQRTADGDLLIDVEDSWGWLRDDINVRYYLGRHAIERFHRWLRDRYADIEAVNRAWGTNYASFDEIDPQKDQGNEGDALGHDLSHVGPVYNRKDHPFHDWSPAVEDWDIFRTELRCDIYDQIHRHVREVIPQAHIVIRTEGALIPVAIDPTQADARCSHLRHVHYVQRRQAMIAEVLQRRRSFKYHSDYTTMPYTEQEWRMLLAGLRRQGMRGVYLPQFCTARDMLLNDHYGRDHQVHYNLPAPRKAAMMHVLQAAYPVWRIQYEEGHCPGVLWEDYMCDGFVTETQKRELRLFRKYLDKAHQASSPDRSPRGME